MPRLTRDEIISQGLELSDCANVIAHDMPGGIVDGNAYAIKWLQNALDMFHRRIPFSADLVSVGLTVGTNGDAVVTGSSLLLPADFIVDVRDGVLVSLGGQSVRLRRRGFQRWLSLSLTTTTQTSFSAPGGGMYTVAQSRIKVWPRLSTAQPATLWYYALPPGLTAQSIPVFPDDYVLVEFVRLKALEWVRAMDPGMAQMYLGKQIAGFRAAGLLNEAEYDTIPLENNQAVIDGYPAPWDWMGTAAGSL